MISFAALLAIFPSNFDAPPAAAPPVVNMQTETQQESLPASDSSWRVPVKGARVFLIGDFLYWTASPDNSQVAYEAKGQSGQLPLNDVKIKPFDNEWSWGFRVGLGYRLPHDRWQAKAYVTQLRTTNHLRQTAKEGSFIQPNFGQIGGGTSHFVRDEGNWHMKYTLFDVELTRSFSASKALAFSPFLGARGAWIHQSTHVKFSGAQSLSLEAHNHYHAGGLRLGADLQFYLMKYVCFFGEASASLLSGRFEDETRVELNKESLFSGKTKPKRLCAAFDLRGGLTGTIPLYRRQSFLSLGLTYDMSIWFLQNQLLAFLSAPDTIQVQTQKNDLTLQGITLTAQLDF